MTHHLAAYGYGGPAVSVVPEQYPNGYSAMQSQTHANNAVSSHYESQQRLAKNWNQFQTDCGVNAVRNQLSGMVIGSLPQALEVTVPPPIDALPIMARNFVKGVAITLGVPAEMVAGCLFGATFIAARGNFKIEVNDHWFEVLTGIIAIAAPPGGRKSAVVSLMRPVFEQVAAERRAEFQRCGHLSLQSVALQTGRQMIRDVARQVQKRMKATGCTLEEAQFRLKDQFAAADAMLWSSRKSQVPPRFLVDSPTMEALACELERQDEAIGTFEAEGGLWKRRIDTSADDIILKSFTGESFSSETKTFGRVELRSPVVAICSLVQSNVLQALYENAELAGHGLTPRMLPILLPSGRGEHFHSSPEYPSNLGDWYEDLIRRLLRIRRPAPANADERTFHVLTLDPAARTRIARYSREIDSQIRDGCFEVYPAFGAKLVGHAIRLAGAIHLMIDAEPHAVKIRDGSMAAAIEWAEFFRAHAQAAFTPEARSGITYAPKILNWMMRHCPATFSERDAHRGIGSSRCTVADIRAGIDQLERCNFLRKYVTGKGAICVVHPNAYGLRFFND